MCGTSTCVGVMYVCIDRWMVGQDGLTSNLPAWPGHHSLSQTPDPTDKTEKRTRTALRFLESVLTTVRYMLRPGLMPWKKMRGRLRSDWGIDGVVWCGVFCVGGSSVGHTHTVTPNRRPTFGREAAGAGAVPVGDAIDLVPLEPQQHQDGVAHHLFRWFLVWETVNGVGLARSSLAVGVKGQSSFIICTHTHAMCVRARACVPAAR